MRSVLCLAAIVCVLALPAFAQTACTPQMTRGLYSVACSGYVSPGPDAPLVPIRALGTVRADFSGSVFTGTATFSLGGTMVEQEVTGTQVLKEDCTGTIKYSVKNNGQSAPDINVRFNVLNGGNKIRGMVTDPGTVMSCTLDRMSMN